MARRRVMGGRKRRVHRRRAVGLGHLMRALAMAHRRRHAGMGRRRRHVGGRRRVHRRRGAGSAFTDFFTKSIPNAARSVYHHVVKPVHGFVKKHGLISKGLALIPHPAGKAAAAAANALGYGRRRRAVGMGRRRRVRRAVGGRRRPRRHLGMGAVTRLVGYGRRRMHARRVGGAAMTGRLYLN
jgi:hypothetical protein